MESNVLPPTRGYYQRKREPILKAAAEACERLGGMAMIDDRYVVVDNSMYDITEKKPVQRGKKKTTPTDGK